MNTPRKQTGRLFGGKLIFLALLAVLLVGCAGGGTGTGTGGGGNGGPVTIVGVETGVDDEIFVNTGTTMSQVTNDYLPGQVTVNLSDETTQTPSVVWESSNYDGNTPGSYTFTGSFTAAEIADSVEVTVTVRGEIELSEHITSPTTLSADYIYRVTGRLNVNAPLTIEAGTVLRFEQDTGLHVQSDGSIIAVGTPSNGILFTATQAERGWWYGLQIRSLNSSNRMEYVTVEYGGGGTNESSVSPANILVGGRNTDGRLTLQNSVSRHSAGYGLSLRENSTMPDTHSNRFAGNAVAPLKAHVRALHFVDGDSDYTDNDHDYVLADNYNSTSIAIDTRDERTWQKLNVPYRVNYLSRIDKTFLIIEPGAVFEFEAGAGFRFMEDAVVRAGAAASDERPGSSTDEPVLFTGVERVPGFWAGIHFRTNPAVSDRQSILDNVIIEYGGSLSFQSGLSQANLVVGGRIASERSQVTLRNSTLRNSGAWGLYLREFGTLANSYNNIYTSNTEGPVLTTHLNLHQLDGGSDYRGNMYSNDFVKVASVTSNIDQADSRLWQALNVPYRVDGREVITRSHITIQAGAEFQFTHNAGLRFMDESQLTVTGTAENRVVFTGVETIPGYWYGLQVASLRDNTIEYAEIAYGGGGTHQSGIREANLVIGSRLDEGRLTMRNSHIHSSQERGIYISNDDRLVNDDILTANTFGNNVEDVDGP